MKPLKILNLFFTGSLLFLLPILVLGFLAGGRPWVSLLAFCTWGASFYELARETWR